MWLDLAAVFATAYERGRYARSLDYASPPHVSLNEEMRRTDASCLRYSRRDARLPDRQDACATFYQTRRQSKLSEKTTQEIDRSYRCGVKFDFLDVRELATVRDYYAVNRAVG